MAEPLAIYWPHDPDGPLIWAAGDGRCGTAYSLAELPPAAAVRVLIPGEWVLVRRLTLPVPSPAKARKALAYLLEDELASEDRALHLAYGTALSGQERLTAAVEQALVHPIYQQISAAGRELQWLGPDFLVPSVGPGQVEVFDLGERWVVAGGHDGGFALDRDLAAQALPDWLAEQAGVEQLVWHGTPPGVSLPGSIQVVPAEPADPTTLAGGLAARPSLPSLTLLQGPLKPRRRLAVDPARWRVAAALLAGVLGVQALGMFAEARQMDRAAGRLQERAGALVQDRFPDMGRLVNPRVQLRNRLAEMGGPGALHGGFLPLLTLVNRTVEAMPEAQVQALRYDRRSGRMALSVQLPGFGAIESFRQRLQQAGAQVEEGAARQSGDGVLGEFELWQP